MSRTFTRIGKEISICVKESGPDPSCNPRLRLLIQNAKAANMPKENVDRAIKKAVSKDFGDYKDMVYEGYGPFGIAVLVETQTDNTTRTVANVRSYFNRFGGSLGTTGSLSFIFERKSVFKVTPKEGLDVEELELEMIDYGAEEMELDDNELVIYGQPEDFSRIQNYLEEHQFEIISAEFERFPNDIKELEPEQRATLDKLIEKLEDDEDVSNVYTTLAPSEDKEDEEA